jgi:hypothetical protein
MVRTNIFLRLLDYRINLADEINADIQRLVSRSSTAGIIDRNTPSPSKKQRQLSTNKIREYNNDDKQIKHSTPPPSVLGQTTNDSDVKHINDEEENSMRELSIKFRTLVQQHRKMIKQLNETDEFVPFLDRKVRRFIIRILDNFCLGK